MVFHKVLTNEELCAIFSATFLDFVSFNLAITGVFDQFNIKQMIRQKFSLITVYFVGKEQGEE